MAYIINTYNGQQLTVVNDGTVDESTDIKLIGRNYAGFGEILNENLVHILQSFAGPSEPPRPLAGQLWYDSANKIIKFYDGQRFRIAGGAEVSNIQPSGLANGDFWWEDEGQQLYVYNGSEFVLVGPVSTGGEGVSQLTAATVKDNVANNRTVLKVTVNDQVLAIISKDEFTLDDSANPITGFSAIKKGFNLASDVSYPDIKYWGTAYNADRLGGIQAAEYIRNTGATTFNDIVTFNTDDGFYLGRGGDLQVHITNGDEVNFSNIVSNTIRFNAIVGGLSSQVGSFVGNEFRPGTSGVGTLGSLSSFWRSLYVEDIECTGLVTGDTFGTHTGDVIGNISGNVQGSVNNSGTTYNGWFNNLTVGGTLTANLTGTSTTAEKLVVDSSTARAAVTTATANTIVARDGSGAISVTLMNGTATNSQQLDGSAASTASDPNTIAKRDSNADIRARIFIGTANAARYADLAENYLADAEYEPGTVLVFGGTHEVTKCDSEEDHRVAGVISTAPAYMMNYDLEGDNVALVALRGRVPCKVIGPVRKGDILITSNIDGCAVAAETLPNSACIVGKSLEDNDDKGEKLVEIVV